MKACRGSLRVDSQNICCRFSRATSRARLLRPWCGAGRTVGRNGQIALLLIEKIVEALVLRWRQMKDRQKVAVAAVGLAQPTVYERGKVRPRHFTGHERLVHDSPEIFAGCHAIPKPLHVIRDVGTGG